MKENIIIHLVTVGYNFFSNTNKRKCMYRLRLTVFTLHQEHQHHHDTAGDHRYKACHNKVQWLFTNINNIIIITRY